ncbi:hypothetical protein NP493_682g01040 [Ridgeia piscesae]|uniref:Uncharacterized protein n=1 Tax=Ridgeia piscesae TaxID=27915 RepID=A0AAD9KRE5_RIDPI|nr:hypothetical protein NP493_682g01040 [Ridgeia piscesae]
MVITDTRKLRNFARSSIAGKDIEQVAGINGVLGNRLRDKGYLYATNLKTKAVSVKKSTFIAWMEAHVNANQLQAGWAYKSLMDHRKLHSRRRC